MSNLLIERKFKDESIILLKIPKGTVLFRTTLGEDNFKDFGGRYDKETDSYCLGYNHAVWFFPYPYVSDTNPYFKERGTDTFLLYITTCDIIVALFIKPSPKMRSDMNKPSDPIIEPCNKQIFCDKNPGFISDPCFKEEFLRENPDVVGSLTISFLDMIDFRKELFAGKLTDLSKFMSFFREAKGFSGVPEFALYPRRIRSFETIVSKKQDYDWIISHMEEFIYIPFQIFSHKPYEKDELYKFMKESLSPKGYSEKKYHLTIDYRTYFYVLAEATDKQTLKECIPIKIPNKLKQLTYKNKKLIFDLAKLYPKK